ncbi:hypothetical protein GCM10010129_01060 [Streptomyces fumigatiscleroticus]|nr:hypothetical protein GCM10010129_01060 [Streptomyces fumigatiscleroticus]
MGVPPRERSRAWGRSHVGGSATPLGVPLLEELGGVRARRRQAGGNVTTGPRLAAMETVELLLDADTERRVQRVWNHLAAIGQPSQEHHGHPTNRPHLTLASVDSLTTSAAESLRALLGSPDCPAVLDGLVRFSGRAHVLAWRVRPVAELLGLHSAVHDALRGAGSEPAHPLLRPGDWQPHITLGRSRGPAWQLPDEQLLPLESRGPVHGRFSAARTYDARTRTTTCLSSERDT